VAATPADRTETWRQEGRVVQAQVWDDLVSSAATPDVPTFTCYRISDPAYTQPLGLGSFLNLSAAEAEAAYRARCSNWPACRPNRRTSFATATPYGRSNAPRPWPTTRPSARI